MLDQVAETKNAFTMPLDTEDFDLSRDPEELLLELDALNAAANVIELGQEVKETEALVRLAMQKRRAILSLEEHLIYCAMSRIVGDVVPSFTYLPEKVSHWEPYVARTVTRAWIQWAEGQAKICFDLVSTLRVEQQMLEKVKEPTGAIHLMSLYFWASAVEALAKGDDKSARRLWKRAMEVGSTFGTPSSILVQWTYVASFFPR